METGIVYKLTTVIFLDGMLQNIFEEYYFSNIGLENGKKEIESRVKDQPYEFFFNEEIVNNG